MKNLKHILIGILIVGVPILAFSYLNLSDLMMIWIPLIIGGIFIFNISVRKMLFFKRYFVSKYNLLTTNISQQETFDIPIDLMFEKMIEVIHPSKFTIVATDENEHEILAITKPTLTSWGENLYIAIEQSKAGTVVDFCSSTYFQVYSWGKNEDNLTDLIEEIEKSLTV